MKSLQNVINKILSIFPYLVVFIFSLYQPSDPDLGWHLKYGQYFWHTGELLRDNTFSAMMPNYHWANTSWLTDIISYTTYHFGGLFGLSLLAASVVTATFYFFAKSAQMSLWEQTIIFPIMLYLEKPVNSVSFRGQQMNLLFVGVLFYLISLYEKKPKLLWLIIPLFWIWVDIDGEFLLGYVLFVSWVGLYITKKFAEKVFVLDIKKEKKQTRLSFSLNKLKTTVAQEKREIGFLLSIVVLSFLATMLTPFGDRLLLSTFSYIGNPLLKDIEEYLPFQMYSQGWWNEIFVGVLLTFGLFILFFRGKFLEKFPILGGGLLLYVLSLQVLRYAWPAYYLLFPLLAMTASFLKPDGKKLTKNLSSILLVMFVAVAIWSRYPFTQYTNFTWNEYCDIQVLPCSSKSAEFLIKHHLNHDIFSLYGWGGWLIWNYPQIKPTIDGRMHLWVQNGYSAFTDYYAVEQDLKDINAISYDVAYISPDKPVYNRLMQLTEEKRWKLVYKDQVAAIFVRE